MTKRCYEMTGGVEFRAEIKDQVGVGSGGEFRGGVVGLKRFQDFFGVVYKIDDVGGVRRGKKSERGRVGRRLSTALYELVCPCLVKA